MKEEFELCRDKHIIHRIYPYWRRNVSLRKAFEIPEDAETAIEKVYVEKCLKFDLEIESSIDQSMNIPFYTTKVKTTLPFEFKYSEVEKKNSVEGESEIENTSFTVSYPVPGCQETAKPGVGDGKFFVLDMIIKNDRNSSEDILGFTKDLNLYYLPGTTNEYYSINCPWQGKIESDPNFSAWTAAYETIHANEKKSSKGFLLNDWAMQYDTFFAEKKWKREYKIGGFVQYKEVGSAKIIHRPDAN